MGQLLVSFTACCPAHCNCQSNFVSVLSTFANKVSQSVSQSELTLCGGVLKYVQSLKYFGVCIKRSKSFTCTFDQAKSKLYSLKPGFHSNAIACVACVACVFCQPIGMLGRSSGNHNWLLANASACVSWGFRLHNARNASDCDCDCDCVRASLTHPL